MKQTMVLKLAPTPEQHAALLETLHTFNDACNYAAEIAYATRTSNKFELQKLVYAPLRLQYKLPAQMAIRAISKTVEAYKRDKSIKPEFRPEGAIVYDPRIMSFKGWEHVSLLTLQGRVLVPFRFGAYQQTRLGAIRGQADLLYRDGRFYLAVTLDLPEPAPDEPQGTLGVDLGIVNLATDSDGQTCSGEHIERTRQKMLALRSALQAKGTKSAKRHLKKLGRRESRFHRHVNHRIAKHLVQKAKNTHRGIALEDLRHIRQRTDRTVKKSQRNRHASWAFYQLRAFISYKAAMAGVCLHLVDPRHTSQTCSQCGYRHKRNRPDRDHFRCKQCEYAAPADYNGAINISRAKVKTPIVAWAAA
jgi:IS605 OrfB family transposase